MNTEKFEKDMAVFSSKEHRFVDTYLTHLFATGWTIEDAKEWVIEHKKNLLAKQRAMAKERIAYEKRLLKCPLCLTLMQLLPVNINKATQTQEDSKSVWLCPNRECMNTIYNKESVAEILKKRGGT